MCARGRGVEGEGGRCTVTTHGWEAVKWNRVAERWVARCGGFGAYFKTAQKSEVAFVSGEINRVFAYFEIFCQIVVESCQH